MLSEAKHPRFLLHSRIAKKSHRQAKNSLIHRFKLVSIHPNGNRNHIGRPVRWLARLPHHPQRRHHDSVRRHGSRHRRHLRAHLPPPGTNPPPLAIRQSPGSPRDEQPDAPNLGRTGPQPHRHHAAPPRPSPRARRLPGTEYPAASSKNRRPDKRSAARLSAPTPDNANRPAPDIPPQQGASPTRTRRRGPVARTRNRAYIIPTSFRYEIPHQPPSPRPRNPFAIT